MQLTKNLKAKKKYYIRVRTYKTVSGKKYYSTWSKTKTVTTGKARSSFADAAEKIAQMNY